MSWYKFANNEFKILSYNNFGEINILSGTGERYGYIGATPPFINKLKMLIKQKRWGEGWQMLRRIKQISGGTANKTIDKQSKPQQQQLNFDF